MDMNLLPLVEEVASGDLISNSSTQTKIQDLRIRKARGLGLMETINKPEVKFDDFVGRRQKE